MKYGYPKVHGTAQNMRYLKLWLDRLWRERAAPVQAQPAKPLESKLVDALLDFDVRGMCAAELLCWHRLTEAESDQLVEFVKIIK